MSGTAAIDVESAAPADSVTTGCAAAGIVGGDDGDGDGDVDLDDSGGITAVSTVSELVGANLAGGSVGAAAI